MYLVDIRTIEVQWPVNIKAAPAWVVHTHGEYLWFSHLWSSMAAS